MDGTLKLQGRWFLEDPSVPRASAQGHLVEKSFAYRGAQQGRGYDALVDAHAVLLGRLLDGMMMDIDGAVAGTAGDYDRSAPGAAVATSALDADPARS